MKVDDAFAYSLQLYWGNLLLGEDQQASLNTRVIVEKESTLVL